MDRRGFLKAMLAASVAPAFIKSENLMKLVIPSQELIVPTVAKHGHKLLISPNTLISPNIILKEALLILENDLVFARNVNVKWEHWNGSTINVKRSSRMIGI